MHAPSTQPHSPEICDVITTTQSWTYTSSTSPILIGRTRTAFLRQNSRYLTRTPSPFFTQVANPRVNCMRTLPGSSTVPLTRIIHTVRTPAKGKQTRMQGKTSNTGTRIITNEVNVHTPLLLCNGLKHHNRQQELTN